MPNLKDKQILLTRPEEGAEEFKRKLDFQRATTITFPLIELKVIEENNLLTQCFDTFDEFEWVVFNSSAAVKFFFQKAEEYGLNWIFYPNIKFATVGEKTKLTLEQLGYRTNFVPIKYTAQVLAENMPDIEGKRILIPASKLTEGNYLEVFEQRGSKPELVFTYENNLITYDVSAIEQIKEKDLDYLTFTSGSTVVAFQEQVGQPQEVFPQAKVICIGPSTAKQAEKLDWKVDAIAQPHTVEGMIDSMIKLEQT